MVVVTVKPSTTKTRVTSPPGTGSSKSQVAVVVVTATSSPSRSARTTMPVQEMVSALAPPSTLAAEPPFTPATWPRTVALAAGVLVWPPPPPPPQPARANAVVKSSPRVAEIRVADVAMVRASRGAGMQSLGTCRVLVKRVRGRLSSAAAAPINGHEGGNDGGHSRSAAERRVERRGAGPRTLARPQDPRRRRRAAHVRRRDRPDRERARDVDSLRPRGRGGRRRRHERGERGGNGRRHSPRRRQRARDRGRRRP